MASVEGARVVPWANWSEWLELKKMLSNGETELACQRVAMYRLRRRGAVPITILTTVALLKQLENPAPDSYLQRLSLSMTLTRFVNGTTDRLQPRGDGSSARSVYSLAVDLQLPLILVEIRHQASHNVLPRLSTLTSGARQALSWLEEHYWEPQTRSAEALIDTTVDAVRRTSEAEQADEDLLNTTLGSVQDICSAAVESDSVEEDGSAPTLQKVKQLSDNLEHGPPNPVHSADRLDGMRNRTRWSLCDDDEAWKAIPLGLVPGQCYVPPSRFVASRKLRGARNRDSHLTGRDLSDGMEDEKKNISEDRSNLKHAASIGEITGGQRSDFSGPKKKAKVLTSEENAYVTRKMAEFELLAEACCGDDWRGNAKEKE